MLKADAYNAKRLQMGEITPNHISQLTREWQVNHDLHVDGMLGPDTAVSIAGAHLGTAVMLRALKVATRSIGNGEQLGNNKGPWLDYVRRHDGTGLPPKNGAWCASFVSWCFTQAVADMGAEGLVPWASSRWVPGLRRKLAEAAFTNEVPEPGAVMIFRRGLLRRPGHTGICESYDPDEDTAVVIEGNVGPFPALVKRVTYKDGSWRRKAVGIYSL